MGVAFRDASVFSGPELLARASGYTLSLRSLKRLGYSFFL